MKSMQEQKSGGSGKMGLWQAVSMAVGTMIGASIFSIFGVGAQIAKQDLPEAFLLSGIYAFIVAYSYAVLSKKIISNAGPIGFILKGIGDSIITGALSILMWLTYVVSLALFAKGFAGYFLPLFNITVTPLTNGILMAAVIALFTVLNFFGSKAIGKVEFLIVLIKVLILGVFIVFGLLTVVPGNLTPEFTSAKVNGLLHASVIFFLSYMGFGLITNASENIVNPSKNIPKAIYLSISIVMVIYVLVSVTALGNLTIADLIREKDNALAAAAKPFLGQFGFLLISVGALFSISSAINATLYGGANISYSLAKDGELPEVFERKIWFKSHEGLYITSGLSLVFALLLNIDGVASITSTIFTIIYIFVLISHIRLSDEMGGNKYVLTFNLIILLAIFILLIYYQWQTNKTVLWVTIAVMAGSLGFEAIYRHFSKRTFKSKD